jgi:large subunit ribosomal protein L29
VKGEEVRQFDLTELEVKERETREQMFRLRFQLQMGQVDGLKKYRALRKDLARILTIRHEMQRQQEQANG